MASSSICLSQHTGTNKLYKFLFFVFVNLLVDKHSHIKYNVEASTCLSVLAENPCAIRRSCVERYGHLPKRDIGLSGGAYELAAHVR